MKIFITQTQDFMVTKSPASAILPLHLIITVMATAISFSTESILIGPVLSGPMETEALRGFFIPPTESEGIISPVNVIGHSLWITTAMACRTYFSIGPIPTVPVLPDPMATALSVRLFFQIAVSPDIKSTV